MEEENSVTPEETGTDSQPEEQTDIEDSSETEEGEDNSSEETENTESEKPKKETAANKRIQGLIKSLKEKDALIAQLTKNKPQMQGISEDGIDPEPYFNSAVEKAKSDLEISRNTKEANEAKQALAIQAINDFPFMKDEVWQEEALIYVERGDDPYTAAQKVAKKINYLMGKEKDKIEKRAQADAKLKNGSFQPSGKQSGSNDGIPTPQEIAKMDTATYEKSRDLIKKHYPHLIYK